MLIYAIEYIKMVHDVCVNPNQSYYANCASRYLLTFVILKLISTFCLLFYIHSCWVACASLL